MANDSWLVLRGDLTGGTASGASPDIILGDAKPDPKYVTEYGTAFDQPGHFGGSNFVYVRAKNAGTALAIGNVSVYAVRIGSLQNQSQWVALSTTDARPNANISADAGKVGVNGAPLVWEPGDAPPPEQPWCLIAEIDGDNQPPIKVPQTVKDQASFDTWIAGQTRLAYLIVRAPAVVPAKAPSFTWTGMVNLANAKAATLDVSLTCTKGPAGGSLSYIVADDGSGHPFGVGKTLYALNNSYSQTRSVPAEFSAAVTVTYDPPADEDNEAEFTFMVATQTGGGGGHGPHGGGSGIGQPKVTVVASYNLSFGQARTAT